ncbi:hypothetical protein OG698_07290 [Streptomyces sp. NBC_01003]|uniref:hypothetical protein n=1 Tax=Streptomyces sp. NBC_01003 TaxID=2903714 RepID=UPI003863CF65|nr:hypothetical protein OG698_07290 [Streptomyces sp. NBC_01003]
MNATEPDLSARWKRFAEAHWGREPAAVPFATGLGPEQVHGAVAASCAPPAEDAAGVRFATAAQGRLRDAGALLPGRDDPGPDAYRDRLARQLAGSGWLLSVHQPLWRDFDLWARVRELVSGLWRAVGWPTLPVTVELALGEHCTGPDAPAPRPGSFTLTWVLAGTMTVRLWPEHTGTEYQLAAGTGDLVYWPAGCRHLDHYLDRCTTLRIVVPARRAAALTHVRGLLADRMQEDPVYAGAPGVLPFPPPTDPDGEIGAAEPVAAAARLFAGLAAGPGPARELRVAWAARRSAAGLEPAPPPRPAVALDPGLRVRASAELLRTPDGPGRAVWAANGHTLAVEGAGAERVRNRLWSERTFTIRELGRGSRMPAESLIPLLSDLHHIRAIELVDGDGAE